MRRLAALVFCSMLMAAAAWASSSILTGPIGTGSGISNGGPSLGLTGSNGGAGGGGGGGCAGTGYDFTVACNSQYIATF
jgi:hypothetical protein